MHPRARPSRLASIARPAALLLLLASSAHGQVQAPVEQNPRGVLRPSIPAPVLTPQGAPRTAAAPSVARPQPQVQPRPTVQPVRPPKTAPAATARKASGVCLIRAGTFSQRANADNLAKTLKPLGAVRVDAVQLNGKPVHLVTIAGLGTRKNAETTMARVKAGNPKLGALVISGC